MRIASWNVNSVNARLDNVVSWLGESAPDVVVLQEIKCQEENFPRAAIEAAGYQAAVVGEKSYNGVALLSRLPFELRQRALPGDDTDTQARYVEADVAGVIVAGIYLPNGNPVDSDEKYGRKLRWMDRLLAHAQALLAEEKPVVIAGDYNVIPENEDCWDPAEWLGDALFQDEVRARYRRLQHMGFTDAFRACDRRGGQYTFWDYQKGRWPRDEGIRIDHALLSPEAAIRLASCQIDRAPRAREKASDHTPLIVTLNAA